jgi:cell division protein FtsW
MQAAIPVDVSGTRHARVAGRARPTYDPWLLGAAAALLMLGLVMVYSASIAYAERATGNGAYFLVRHAAHVALGIGLFAIVVRLPVRLWEYAGPYLLLAGIVLLALVLVPGLGGQVNGSVRWIRLGLFNLQPSELMKLFMIVYVAGYLVRKQEELANFTQGILMMSLVVAVVGVLLLQEPDLGSLAVIGFTVFTMLFLGGVRFWHFALVSGLGIGSITALTIIAPYRLGRVTSFLDPWADPFGSGYQIVQSLIAVGSGGILGRGFMAGVQKLYYIPEPHNDYIFAVIAEELGLIGTSVALGCFAVIAWRGLRTSLVAPDRFGSLLALGLTMMVTIQAFMNVSVVIAMLPPKGIPLPFVSNGGSSLLVNLVAMGILLNISQQASPAAAAEIEGHG